VLAAGQWVLLSRGDTGQIISIEGNNVKVLLSVGEGIFDKKDVLEFMADGYAKEKCLPRSCTLTEKQYDESKHTDLIDTTDTLQEWINGLTKQNIRQLIRDVNKLTRVAPSGIKDGGNGLFAKEDVFEGKVIAVLARRSLDHIKANRIMSVEALKLYNWTWQFKDTMLKTMTDEETGSCEGTILPPSLNESWAVYKGNRINHGPTQQQDNTVFEMVLVRGRTLRESEIMVLVVASKHILAGTEFLCDYGRQSQVVQASHEFMRESAGGKGSG
jgi:hypothetical protein